MRWNLLAGVLGVVLVAAIVFAVMAPRFVTTTPDDGALAPVNSAAPTPTPAPSTARPERLGGPPGPTPTRLPATGPSVSPAAGPVPTPIAQAFPPAAGPSPSAPSIPSTEPGVAPDGGVPFPLNKDGIKSAVREKVPELRDCYDAWLQADPGLAGRIKVSFTIEEDPETGLGHVTEIGVMDGGIDHLALQGCVLNVFQGLSFEAPENGPLKVNYPLNFSSGDGG